MDRTLRSIAPTLLLVASLLVLPACQTVNTTERADPDYERVYIEDARVTTDNSLKKAAGLVRLNETTLDSGFLKVQAEVYNDTRERKRAHYRFEWFDADGMLIKTSLSNWKAISLAGKESQFITAVSPTKTATDFRLKLIEPEK
ncbi:YcfL family protein [Algisphaera agarilytica]|uniref:Uncharacterized protein YcfL n=1 Tax=Algisphaera agarilytica TaxID=1385975 RepID=A0A7X0LM61_9BACT|nr:YcfL family protein [Algisphaera agarilytica]MBB6430683.1 uncharacterized protein YcfL [Algisphaera agarilytica]